MKIYIVFVLLLSIYCPAFSQSCNCAQEFQYVKQKIEKNYAGFKDKVSPKTVAAYQRYSMQVLEKSKKITYSPYCIYLINEWIGFFRDGHIEVGRNRMSKDKYAADQERLIQNAEKLKINKVQLAALKTVKGIEGFYWSKDSVYRIVVVKNKNRFRDYAGVILESKNKAWEAGSVNLELKLDKDSLKGLEYDKYHTPVSVAFKIAKNRLGDWQREGAQKSETEKILTSDVSCRVLSDQTFYIQIGTFNQRNAKRIDSLIGVNKAILSRVPNLIIDLRNNGGGADFSYKPLMPYLYTNPIKSIGPNILSSEDNISGWQALLNMADIPESQKVFIREKIAAMEKHKGDFVNLGEDSDLILDSVMAFPEKIVVLVNKGCGSTTEEFLLAAKQSKKVTFMGESSAGVLDYANVRDISFSCMPYALHYATSRSRRVDVGQGIDNVGIQPDYRLTPTQNWVIAAQRFLEKD